MLFALRAVFWLGVVAFLMPHEPDIGFGRPRDPAQTLRLAIVSELAVVRARIEAAQVSAPGPQVASR